MKTTFVFVMRRYVISSKSSFSLPSFVEKTVRLRWSYEDEYELSSLLLGNDYNVGGGGGGGGGEQYAKKSSVTNIKQQRLWSSSVAPPSSSSSYVAAAAFDRKNSYTDDKLDDGRSRAVFVKTAFWITAWYGTSLAILFQNNIILSRPDSSGHVLEMCQMTARRSWWGGWWSAFGGTGIVVGAITSVLCY